MTFKMTRQKVRDLNHLKPIPKPSKRAAPPEVQAIDLCGLREACDALTEYSELIRESLKDLGSSWEAEQLFNVIRAIEHVLDDDFRSRETRGGS